MKPIKYTRVSFDQATDAELKVAAHFAGADEVSGLASILDTKTISRGQRQKLIDYLTVRCKYKSINIDPKNRLTRVPGMSDFGLAQPMKEDPEEVAQPLRHSDLLVNALVKVFGAESHREVGHEARGGYREIVLKQPKSFLEVKQAMRRAISLAGFRSQSGFFARRDMSHDGSPEFYVIRGNYNMGTKGVIRLEGTAQSPRLSVEFGG